MRVKFSLKFFARNTSHELTQSWGAPGLRDEGGEGFYAAYFRDLEGHKLDVFCCGQRCTESVLECVDSRKVWVLYVSHTTRSL